MANKEKISVSLITLILCKHLGSIPMRSNEEFEEWINKSVDKPDQITKEEAVAIIKHFRKEIFPLDRETIMWMYKNLQKDDINFYTRFKEMKNLIK